VSERELTFYGVRYSVPALVNSPEIVLAVNVRGAVIPTLFSIFLLSKNGLWGHGLIETAIIAAICRATDEPIRGVGVGLPIFVAPVATAIVAAVVSWRYASAAGLCRRPPWHVDQGRLAQSGKAQGPRSAGGRRVERAEAARPRRRAW